MDEKQEKARLLRDMVERAALLGTPPKETLRIVRAMLAGNPHLLEFDSSEQWDDRRFEADKTPVPK